MDSISSDIEEEVNSMAKPTSPSPPHTSGGQGRHVDIAASGGGKIHQPVQHNVGATAIGGAQRAGARAAKGR
jgi:hypothetical protein